MKDNIVSMMVDVVLEAIRLPIKDTELVPPTIASKIDTHLLKRRWQVGESLFNPDRPRKDIARGGDAHDGVIPQEISRAIKSERFK